QPVVENAVIHGCELKKTATTITIRSILQEDDGILEVAEDGKGVDNETLQHLRQKLEQTETEGPETLSSAKGLGIGLTNVHKRIKLKYGASYGLSIHSQLNQGTTVRIKLPMHHN